MLYQSTLTDPSILDQFAAGTNFLPSIMDGGKRDRNDFTGDIGISGLTLLYSTFAREYLAGSIELFSSFQASDGGIADFAPTTIPSRCDPLRPYQPHLLGHTGLPTSTRDLDYHYYLYTGDKRLCERRGRRPKVIALYAILQQSATLNNTSPFFGAPRRHTKQRAFLRGVAPGRAIGRSGGSRGCRHRL